MRHNIGTVNRKDELFYLCREFIHENNITCSETIFQTDSVIVNAYDFIEKICDIVGYVKPEEEGE